ncbi:serine hydrolase [Telluribacter sp.]|jgi:CubicO group peptidase (beta-lactamase class C family)|uniref:serine hydrolase domain-containing protein n=1 Tax=Telluribacter sp. TaxID=1978767 RepID=UPI002E121626|nr:serine hydrolase [Telluribacter sp.]
MSSNRREFIKQLGAGTAGAGLLLGFSGYLFGQPTYTKSLRRSTSPEAQGMDSAGIINFLDAVAQSKHEFHSLMILRHGQVVAEGWWNPYRPDLRHTLYSMSKSFTSTAIGLAVHEGRLTVDDKVISFFPDKLPAQVSENLAALRVRDLLSMSVGHEKDSTAEIRTEDDWVRKFLSLPIKYQPGTRFLYNSGATYMLSAIVQKLTGQRVVEYLKPRLFDPLGIEGMDWERDPKGIDTGGWGLRVRTEDLAKFGQLYLQKGQWNGKQILPKAWVEEATSFKIQQPIPANNPDAKEKSDWLQGYCYQFWRCRHNAYRGDGAFGQYTIVMPDQDAVIAITSETSNMQGQLDLIYEHLLPAMQAKPLSANTKTAGTLKTRLAALSLPPLPPQKTSPVAAKVSGQTFKVADNALKVQSVAFQFGKDNCTITLKDDKDTYPITVGLGQWKEGVTSLPGTPPNLVVTPVRNILSAKVAASGTWKDENTFEMLWRYIESTHHDQVTCHFEGDKVRLRFRNSMVAMNPNAKDARPELLGQLV